MLGAQLPECAGAIVHPVPVVSLQALLLVGTAGFEPATTTPPVWCATRLRYAPKLFLLITISEKARIILQS